MYECYVYGTAKEKITSSIVIPRYKRERKKIVCWMSIFFFFNFLHLVSFICPVEKENLDTSRERSGPP